MAVKPTFFRRLKGVIQLVGSPAEGERHSAADKAFEMCEAESISLQEALEGIFGRGSRECSNDAELQAKIDELERDSEMMAGELRRMQEQSDTGYADTDQGYKRALKKIWSHPQTRLAAAFCMIVIALVLLAYWSPFKNSFVDLWLKLGFGVLGLGSFGELYLKWIYAEDQKNGLAVVFVKSLIIIGGLVLCIYEFYGTLVFVDWQERPTNLVGAITVVVMTLILSISNAVPWLVRKLAQSSGQPFKTLRAWFA